MEIKLIEAYKDLLNHLKVPEKSAFFIILLYIAKSFFTEYYDEFGKQMSGIFNLSILKSIINFVTLLIFITSVIFCIIVIMDIIAYALFETKILKGLNNILLDGNDDVYRKFYRYFYGIQYNALSVFMWLIVFAGYSFILNENEILMRLTYIKTIFFSFDLFHKIL